MKVFLMMLGFIFSLTAIAACSTKPDRSVTKSLAMTEAACSIQGGTWQRMGRAGNYACVLTTVDSGKSCTDSSQCEERCLLFVTATPADYGKPAVGFCQSTNQPFGCASEVKKGIAQRPLCID